MNYVVAFEKKMTKLVKMCDPIWGWLKNKILLETVTYPLYYFRYILLD